MTGPADGMNERIVSAQQIVADDAAELAPVACGKISHNGLKLGGA